MGDNRVFDNGQTYTPNSCYCTGASCPDLLKGVHNMSDCRFGAPVFASFPHFYLADSAYVRALEGMNPDQSKHEVNNFEQSSLAPIFFSGVSPDF